MPSKKQIFDCIPASSPGVHASHLFERLGITHYKFEDARNEVRREVRGAIDRGEISLDAGFAMTLCGASKAAQ